MGLVAFQQVQSTAARPMPMSTFLPHESVAWPPAEELTPVAFWKTHTQKSFSCRHLVEQTCWESCSLLSNKNMSACLIGLHEAKPTETISLSKDQRTLGSAEHCRDGVAREPSSLIMLTSLLAVLVLFVSHAWDTCAHSRKHYFFLKCFALKFFGSWCFLVSYLETPAVTPPWEPFGFSADRRIGSSKN